MFPLHDVRYLQRNAQGASRNSINRPPWDRTGRAQAQSQFAKPLRRSGGASEQSAWRRACLAASRSKPAGETTSKKWWSQTGSNRRPQACKASALPTELWPRTRGRAASAERVVGLGGFEPPTSRLSSARSNQLSYKPVTPQPPNAARHPSRGPAGSSLEERETKTAAVPHDRPDWPCCLSVPIGFFG